MKGFKGDPGAAFESSNCQIGKGCVASLSCSSALRKFYGYVFSFKIQGILVFPSCNTAALKSYRKSVLTDVVALKFAGIMWKKNY